ncbi:hypothetical protein [Massilia sp. TSP1-1-2]|uniref:hypothetical protein n=1 Tax=Massilia sp. TSP1-1-2 TaxID=2804649 RepID=UPI003CF689BD
MPAGFQVIGEHGSTQIDDTYFNFACVAKGTINMPASANSSVNLYGLTPVTLTMDGTYPMLFIAPKNTVACVSRVAATGASHEFTIHGGLTEAGQPLAESFSWFLFDRPPPPVLHGSGLQVFNAAAQCTFDSNYPPMRIAGLLTVPTGLADASMTLASGDYACGLGQGRRGRTPNNVTTGATLIDAFKITPTQVKLSLKYLLFGGPSNGSTYTNGGGGQALVIDVSRL